jgi:putative ABC transport system permease protein
MAAAQSIWKMAFRNLSNQNKTTVLTVAAIAVCVMTFVSIFSILDGLQRSVEQVIKGYYGRKVYVVTSSGAGEFSDSSVPRSVIEGYRSLPEVYALSAEDFVVGQLDGVEVDIVGVELEDLLDIHPFQEVEGREMEVPGECMVGTTAAGIAGIEVGDDLSIQTGETELGLDVVGVYEVNTSLSANILVDSGYLASEMPRFERNASILRIKLKTEEIGPVNEFTESQSGLEIREAVQVSQFFQKSIINISRLLSTIVVFVILLMVLGIYNSMNMVVSERSREIGIIRAMGARRSFVLKLFIAESIMLSLLGGLFGVALGVAMSHGITSVISAVVSTTGSVAPLTKLTTVGWGIVASVTIGLIGGILPASRASKVQISQALTEA